MATATLTGNRFGESLRQWRIHRHLSQLELASEAGVSQRHLSFLETGRSKPSREMVIHLGTVLDLSLRDRNGLLISAGFAPVYSEGDFDGPDLAPVSDMLRRMLEAHDPLPAYLVDRRWDLVEANRAAAGLIAALPEAARALAGNMVRLTFHPDGIRWVALNWAEAARHLLGRLEREVQARPHDEDLSELLAEIRAYEGVDGLDSLAMMPSAGDLLVPLRLRLAGASLAFYTTIATLGGPHDVTLEELRLETLLPADEPTRQFLHAESVGRPANG